MKEEEREEEKRDCFSPREIEESLQCPDAMKTRRRELKCLESGQDNGEV